MMNYFALAKGISRASIICTEDYTSCECIVCDQSRRDHWADQQFNRTLEERAGWEEEEG
jgi:hypothetical protein